MDLKQFEYVLTINEEKSFSKAAKRLFISQPSLSQYINRLENQLGVSIFDRNSVPLTLTYEGQLYIDTALQILSLLDNLNKQFQDVTHLKIGKLNIGLTPSKATNPLPAILPVFKEKYPGIELIITEATSQELEDMLTRNMVDVCMLNLPIKSKQIEYEPILTEKLFLATPPDFSLNREEKLDKNGFPIININEIKDEYFILLHSGQRLRQIADNIFSNAGIKPKMLLETASIDTALRLTASGMGFSFVPESYVRFSALATPPKYYSVEDASFNWTLVIAYKQGAYRSKVVNAFSDVVKEVLTSKK